MPRLASRLAALSLVAHLVTQPAPAQEASLPRPGAELPATPPSSSTPLPAPPLASSRRWEPFRLIIPAMGLDTLVVRGVDDETLRAGPGYDPLSDGPGQKGNCVIASHRNVHGAHFWYLPKLMPNALIALETSRETLVYKVVFARVVPGEETSALDRPPHPLAAPRLTLYTCTLPKSTNRFIVVANLIGRRPASTLPFNRKAIIPPITSGPLHLLKDPDLRKRLKLPPLPPKIKP